MFCPSCRGEFRAGFTRCRDCDVDLVEELPAEVEAGPGLGESASTRGWAGAGMPQE